jgi:hypothetical protein|tara:strand:+ start:1776 stop:2162 length:387 start_codon:yes stop_codon:yes gene_type:complete
MASYALLDDNNIVTQVITGKDEGGGTDYETVYGNFHGQTCKRTSYNTQGNTHLEGGTPFRGNYAGVGHVYDSSNDVFYIQQPHASWTISADTNWLWKPPIDRPDDGNQYEWNESKYQADNTQGWDIIE